MIVVFGSINVDIVVAVEDLPKVGETVIGPSYRVAPGGKGANQALAAARAGAAVRMFGRVGSDLFASPALAELRAGGVDIARVAVDERHTGLAMIAVDSRGQNQIVVASGANQAASELEIDDALLGKQTLVVLQMEVSKAENWRLVERAKRRGARVLLNCAPAGKVPRAALAAVDWVVVNEAEATKLARKLALIAADANEAARAIVGATGTTVIVTLGDSGAAFYGKDEAWIIGALPVTPVDSTAAGDAFVGAFAAAMDAGSDAPAALRRASIAGALACLVAGAQPSLPTKQAIDARLEDLPAAMPANS